MFKQLWQSVLFSSLTLHTVAAQTACNNSPDLCERSYSNITYLGAHNSPFLRDETTSFSTSGNQFYNTTTQLAAGVRLVSAQVQTPNDTSSDLHVCHTSCSLLDAGTLESWLTEIKTWMDANPNDVVTILLVNGASASASELGAAYTASGMDQYAYTPTNTTAHSDWPTLQTLISAGTRSMNFVASLSDNAAATYLMNEFTYLVENDYDNSAPTDFSCQVSRPSSLANQAATAPINQVKFPPVSEFTIKPPYVTAAIGIVNPLLESNKNPGRKNKFLIFGKFVAIESSASRFVLIYLAGKIGAPAAAEIYAKLLTPASFASLANTIAESRFMSS